MFEKEAEEYYHSNLEGKVEVNNESRLEEQFEETFRRGAISGYNKANEWHYVKDGLPQYNEYVLIYTDLKNTYVARIPTEKNYFITRRGGFVQMSAVIAWKEIVLPELKESE